MNPEWGAIHIRAFRDWRRTWPQTVLIDLLARALAVTVLTPAVALLLKIFLMSTATGVVSDAAILRFLLGPAGLAALVIVGGVTLTILFAETGALMVVGFGAIEDRRVTWLDAFRYAIRHAAGLFRLAESVLVRLLLIAAPFVGSVGVLYWLLLGEHDINFYLSERPPEFVLAMVVAGLLLGVLACWILWKIAGWLFALPRVLFEGAGAKDALRTSDAATRPWRGQLIVWLVAWLVTEFLLRALVSYGVGILGSVLIPRATGSVVVVVAALGLVLAVSGLANLGMAVLGTTLFPLVVIGLYRSLAGPGAMRPEVAERGSLGRRASWRIPGKAILGVSAALLAGVTVAGWAALRSLDREDDAVVIAHRGGAAAAPENTMAAFTRAIEIGADWIELDVQENADGTVIVVHDSDFMRVAGVNLKVWDATSDELRGMDIGSFFAPGFSDQRVPALREVLEVARGRIGVFIELKYYGHDVDLESKVVEIVESTEMRSEVVIMSLEYDKIRKAAALRPDWTYGLLNTVSIGDPTRLDLDFLALNTTAATYSTIRRAHERGMKVYVWTVDDPVQMSVMLSRGVDGIITDKPALGREIRELRAQLTPLGRLVVWVAGETGLLRGMAPPSTREDA